MLEQILLNDPLYVLLALPNILNSHKIVKRISYFYFGFMIVIPISCILYIAINNVWYVFLTQYAAFGGGLLIVLSSYATMYLPQNVNTYRKLYEEIFPALWPLDSVGQEEFQYFQNFIKLTKGFLIVVLVAVLTGATAGLPWSSDHYDIMFPVKIGMDYLDERLLKLYLTIFYSFFYHFSLTVLANLSCLIYLVLHLYIQLHMINAKLKQITDHGSNSGNNGEDEKLTSYIKHHQILLRLSDGINEIIYFPMFYYTISGIVIAISTILIQKAQISKADLFAARCVALIVAFVASAFCWLGQLVENESHELLNSTYDTPWYHWNIKTRKILLIFLTKLQKNMVLSSSGLITMNYPLLIRLYRSIYSTVTFLVNAASARKQMQAK